MTQSTGVHSTKRKFSRSGKELGQGRPSQRVFGSQSCQPPGALLSPQGTGQHSASRSPVLAQGAWKAAASVHRAAERADESTWDLGTYWGGTTATSTEPGAWHEVGAPEIRGSNGPGTQSSPTQFDPVNQLQSLLLQGTATPGVPTDSLCDEPHKGMTSLPDRWETRKVWRLPMTRCW